MWGGTGIHDVLEQGLRAKIEGRALPSLQESTATFLDSFREDVEKYQTAQKAAKLQGKNTYPNIDWGERIKSQETLEGLYVKAVELSHNKIIPSIKPLEVEKLMIHHFDVNTGGTIPMVGFMDLIEERNGDQMVSDHKVGKARSQESAETDDQLTLYSMATGIPSVSITNVALGTTGGSTPSRAKPPQFLRLESKRTMKDYERLSDTINHILTGIKSGSFPRTAHLAGNQMVCGKKSCAYYDDCLGR